MTSITDTRSTDKSAGELPRLFLRPFLLLALGRDGPSHGYELCECVRGQGLSVDLAGVYRGLRTMEQHDLVTSRWEPSDAGPDRRVYSLTDSGQDEASAAMQELESVRNRLAMALDAFSAEPERRTA